MSPQECVATNSVGHGYETCMTMGRYIGEVNRPLQQVNDDQRMGASDELCMVWRITRLAVFGVMHKRYRRYISVSEVTQDDTSGHRILIR